MDRQWATFEVLDNRSDRPYGRNAGGCTLRRTVRATNRNGRWHLSPTPTSAVERGVPGAPRLSAADPAQSSLAGGIDQCTGRPDALGRLHAGLFLPACESASA